MLPFKVLVDVAALLGIARRIPMRSNIFRKTVDQVAEDGHTLGQLELVVNDGRDFLQAIYVRGVLVRFVDTFKIYI